jgi:glutamate-1-semialdehyde aminotransferase
MVEVAEKLDDIALFIEDARCFLTNSGTEAIEAAITLARYHTGQPQFIDFYGAFVAPGDRGSMRTADCCICPGAPTIEHRLLHQN